jgi:hypothetical protein
MFFPFDKKGSGRPTPHRPAGTFCHQIPRLYCAATRLLAFGSSAGAAIFPRRLLPAQ